MQRQNDGAGGKQRGVHTIELSAVREFTRAGGSRLAMERVGRNEPCPCGSGRKYKRCCQPNEAERLAFVKAVFDRAVPLLSQLAHFAQRAVDAPLERLAHDEFPFWRGSVDASRGARVLDFLMFDYRLPLYGARAVDEFLRQVGPSLTDEQRSLVRDWSEATRRPYRAVDWSGGFTTCADLIEETAPQIILFELEEDWRPAVGDAFALRALPIAGGHFCAGRPQQFSGRAAGDVTEAIRARHLRFVRTQRIVGIDEFLRIAPKALDEEAAQAGGASSIILPPA
jgi:hypothetical protein